MVSILHRKIRKLGPLAACALLHLPPPHVIFEEALFFAIIIFQDIHALILVCLQVEPSLEENNLLV